MGKVTSKLWCRERPSPPKPLTNVKITDIDEASGKPYTKHLHILVIGHFDRDALTRIKRSVADLLKVPEEEESSVVTAMVDRGAPLRHIKMTFTFSNEPVVEEAYRCARAEYRHKSIDACIFLYRARDHVSTEFAAHQSITMLRHGWRMSNLLIARYFHDTFHVWQRQRLLLCCIDSKECLFFSYATRSRDVVSCISSFLIALYLKETNPFYNANLERDFSHIPKNVRHVKFCDIQRIDTPDIKGCIDKVLENYFLLEDQKPYISSL